MNLHPFATLEALRTCVAREAFITDWVTVTQKRIDLFAEATDDYQWIHVDADRAKRESDRKSVV